MNDTAAVKKSAKKHLEDNWSKAFSAMAIVLLASLAAFIAEEFVNGLMQGYGVTQKLDLSRFDINTQISDIIAYLKEFVTSGGFRITALVTLFFILIRFLVLTPLHQGQTSWFYSVVEGTDDRLSRLFYYYSTNDMYLSALSFRFSLFMKKLGYGIISFIAPAASLGLTLNQYLLFRTTGNEADKKRATLYLIITIALLLLGLILFFLLSLKIFIARYVFARYTLTVKHANTGKCFSEASRLISKNKSRVVSLFISMLPLFISCVLILPLLYVYPYFFCCCAELANEIMIEGSEKK